MIENENLFSFQIPTQLLDLKFTYTKYQLNIHVNYMHVLIDCRSLIRISP